MRKRPLLPIVRRTVVAFSVVACLAGCANRTKVDVVRDTTAGITAKPAVVYVMDFDLDADKIKLDPRRAREERRPGLLKQVRHSLGLSETPQEEANDLIGLMAQSIVAGLTKAGMETHRIPPGAPLAKAGWLVRGSFLQVDEGNRLRRAIGGAGQTDMQVAVTVDDLAVDPNQAPLLQLNTDTDAKGTNPPGSGGGTNMRVRGAGGRMALYSVAVKYVLAGYDLDRNAKETGAKIAEEVVRRVRGIAPAAPSVAPQQP